MQRGARFTPDLRGTLRRSPTMPPRRPVKRSAGTSYAKPLALVTLLLAGGALLWVLLGKHGAGQGLREGALKGEAAAAEAAAAADAALEAELAGLGPAARFVRQNIRKHRVTVFSKSYCGYSARGKEVMRKLVGEAGVNVVELDQLKEGEPAMWDVQQELGAITGATTVPRIFVDGEFIGGADDVSHKAETGELQALLGEKNLMVH